MTFCFFPARGGRKRERERDVRSIFVQQIIIFFIIKFASNFFKILEISVLSSHVFFIFTFIPVSVARKYFRTYSGFTTKGKCLGHGPTGARGKHWHGAVFHATSVFPTGEKRNPAALRRQNCRIAEARRCRVLRVGSDCCSNMRGGVKCPRKGIKPICRD